jgi:anti-sigma factor RsiW
MRFTCREVTELLIDYVENSMSFEQRHVLERHICGCPPCLAYLHTYQATIHMTHRLPEEPLPPEFEKRLQAVLAEELALQQKTEPM